jgi:hypothetical protein
MQKQLCNTINRQNCRYDRLTERSPADRPLVGGVFKVD